MMLEPTTRVAISEEERVMPDTLLPTQLTTQRPSVGERALLASVLLDAVDCFVAHCGATTASRRRLFEDAEQWIFDDDIEAPLSFENVCDFLSLDAECLRSTLRAA